MLLEAMILAQLSDEPLKDTTISSTVYSQSLSCVIPTMPPSPPGTIVNSVCVTNTAVTPRCPDGYQLMADLMMHPKCAREVIDPEK